MNQKQRKRIAALSKQLEGIREELEQISQEEQDKIDNLPESLQGTSKEDEYQTVIDAIAEAVEAMDSAIEYVEAI